MPNQKLITLRLDENHVGQIIDGLDVLIEDWEATARYLRTGDYWDEFTNIRECSHAGEAEGIAAFYRDIRESLDTQLEAADG